MTSAAPRRRGRPPRAGAAEGPGTRDLILQAARQEFSERGYDKVSVRGIAKSAGVDSALVHHYFGTKDQVFEAAVEVAFAPAITGADVVAAGPPEAVGERLTRFIFGIWENPATRAPLLAIVRSAVNHEAAAGVFRRLVAAQLLSRIVRQLDLPDAELRAELAAAQLVGVAILRYVIKVEPLASVPVDEIIARVAPVVQGHLTGFGDGGERGGRGRARAGVDGNRGGSDDGGADRSVAHCAVPSAGDRADRTAGDRANRGTDDRANRPATP